MNASLLQASTLMGVPECAKAALADLDLCHEELARAIDARVDAKGIARASRLQIVDSHDLFAGAVRAVAGELTRSKTKARDGALREEVFGHGGRTQPFTDGPDIVLAAEARGIAARALTVGVQPALCSTLETAADRLMELLVAHETKQASVTSCFTVLKTARKAWDRAFRKVRFLLEEELSLTELARYHSGSGATVRAAAGSPSATIGTGTTTSGDSSGGGETKVTAIGDATGGPPIAMVVPEGSTSAPSNNTGAIGGSSVVSELAPSVAESAGQGSAAATTPMADAQAVVAPATVEKRDTERAA